MNDSDGLSLFILALIIGVIWLAVKLNKSRAFSKSLEKLNSDLTGQNNILRSENTQLITQNAMLEAEHLKFQLQPHTLGNVVTTLNTIAKNLHRGTESLAESLNYILYKGNNHLVTVEEESNFIKKYIQLNKLLFSEMISTRIDVTRVNKSSKHYTTNCVPHLISAYLVENAFKHGHRSHDDFLNIELILNDDAFEMIVVNRISPKQIQTENGGLGLKNMVKRLEILLNGKYELNSYVKDQSYYSSLIIRF